METCKTATYEELRNKEVQECGERFVPVNLYDSRIEYGALYVSEKELTADEAFQGRVMLVREQVAQLLGKANRLLESLKNDCTLYISCGYRSPEAQMKRFMEAYEKSVVENPLDRLKSVNRFVASPEVAGHPTGGAVDVTVRHMRTKSFLDMGCKISEYSKGNYQRFSRRLSALQSRNRGVLHYCLTEQGFFPSFDKWWHFCYGDKEWAVYFDIPHAMYDSVPSSEVRYLGK